MKQTISSLERLDNIKLRLYQTSLTIACVVLLILYWQMNYGGPLNDEERFVIPSALVFCITSLIFFKIYKERYLVPFDFIVSTLVVAYHWFHYMAGLSHARQMNAPISFDRFLIWLPIVYAVFFLCFSTHQATLASGVFLFSLGIPAAYHLWKIQGRETFAEDFSMLVNMFASGMVFTVIFLTLATMKERYTEAISTARALKIRAEVDHLTQVYSRAKIFEALERRLAAAPAPEHPLSIIVIDMDNLKFINDKYGHATGDQALKQIALAINNALRRSDLVGRIGGDEFLVICQETGEEEIGKLEIRLQKAVSDLQVTAEALSISCGSATWQPGETIESLFHRADQSMYRNKNLKKTPVGHPPDA